jgi:branched-chain amino acid transport system substrate-binding protein
MTRRRTIAAAAILAGALALTACGTNRQEASGTGAGGSSCDTSKGTLVIGMIAPLSGELSALGLGMRNSADLAVDQANAACKVPGYKLAFQPEDDQKTPQVAGQAATKLSSDPNVVGVVGTLNSSTSQTVQPILAGKKIVQVSPANTNPTLTLGNNPAAPARPFPTYFRTATTDLIQGPFAADYLIKKAGKKKAVVIDDGLTYGVGLADEFSKEFTKAGGQVVGRERVGDKDTVFDGVIAKVVPLAPDVVYYGGQYPQAGPLSKQLAAAGVNVPLMGGDGIQSADFVGLGGKDGDLATSVGAPAESLPSAGTFIVDYKKANYTEVYETYGVLTFDATNVIIDGLAKVVANGGTFDVSKRQALLDAVAATKFDGASGPVAFDQYGDTTNKTLTVYAVKGGAFTTVESGSFAG